MLQISVFYQVKRVDSVSRYIGQTSGLTANEAVKYAIEHNDQLLALAKDAEAAEKLVGQANKRAQMSVTAKGLQETFGGSYRRTIQGSMPLELGGRRKARVLVATREAEIKRKAVEQSQSAIAAEVRSKFGESLAKAQKLKLIEEMLASILESYELISARVEEGKTAPLEKNMMLVELNRLRSKREMTESNVQIALLELRNLIGMLPETPVRIKGEFDNSMTIFPGLGELTSRALQKRPDLSLLRAMENLADSKIRQSKTVGKLDANATIGYQRLRINNIIKFNYLVFGLKFTLPQRNRNRAAIESSILTKAATEKRRAFGELVVRKEVATAYTRYNSAVRTKEIIRVGVVEQAEKNLSVVRQTYELGKTSLLVFLGEQRRFIDLKVSLINAHLEVYLAKVEIQRAVFATELISK